MKLLLKPLRQAIPDELDEVVLIAPEMQCKFGKVVEVYTTGDNYWSYADYEGWHYLKEWFVTDHELLKELKKHL